MEEVCQRLFFWDHLLMTDLDEPSLQNHQETTKNPKYSLFSISNNDCADHHDINRFEKPIFF